MIKELMINEIAGEDERKIQETQSIIEMVYGEGYVDRYYFKNSSAYGGQNGRGKGNNSGRNTQQAKIREWHFDTEVEEMNDPNSKNTSKRAYQLQNIEKAFAASVRVQTKSLSLFTSTANAIMSSNLSHSGEVDSAQEYNEVATYNITITQKTDFVNKEISDAEHSKIKRAYRCRWNPTPVGVEKSPTVSS